jgi:hypothetical protein
MSFQAFSPNEQILSFETRVKVSYADGGFWGFWGDDHSSISFMVDQAGELLATVRENSTTPVNTTVIPSIDPLFWHIYRIEVSNNQVQFFVDNELKVTIKEDIPVNSSFYIRLDRVSWGVNRTTQVDYVQLQSLNYIKTPGLIFIPMLLNFVRTF